MKTGLLFLFSSVFFIVSTAACAEPEPNDGRKFLLTLDKSKTVFDGPLLPDGRIDYISAMNERDAKRVAHEDNAFRALSLLIDASVFDDDRRRTIQQSRRLLAITEKEIAASPKLQDWHTYGEAQGLGFETVNAIEEQVLDMDFTHPQIEVFEAWLKAQQPALDAALAASRLPKYWQPILPAAAPPNSGEINLLGLSSHIGLISRCLMFRALHAVHEGEFDLAGQYVIALRRLGIHQGQGPFSIDAIVANVSYAYARRVMRLILNRAGPNHKAIKTLARQWLSMPAPPRWHELMAKDEVVYALNRYMAIAAGDISLDDPEQCYKLDDATALETAIDEVGVDLDVLVRRTRAVMAAEAERLKAETYTEYLTQKEAYDKVWEPRRKALRERYLVEDNGSIRLRLPDEPMGSAEVAQMIFDVPRVLDWQFDFNMDTGRAEFGQLAQRKVADAAVGCVWFHLDHGRYPARLAELVPDYLPAAPVDPIDGEPLRYRYNADGSAVVYSVYLDREDDGGTTDPDDFEALEDGDYCWQLPAPKR